MTAISMNRTAAFY